MMPDLGQYAVNVLAAYAVSITLIAGLILISFRRAAKVKKQLQEIETDQNTRNQSG